MKLNYLSRLKTGQLLNLKVLKTPMLYVGLNFVDWLLTKLLRSAIGYGFGQKFSVLLLLTMKPQQFLFLHQKDTITFMNSLNWEEILNKLRMVTNHGDLRLTIIR